MSRPQARAGAALLRARYARTFKVPLEDVRVEYREDVDDVEVWAPGAGHVWTLGCTPYETTCVAAGARRTDSNRSSGT